MSSSGVRAGALLLVAILVAGSCASGEEDEVSSTGLAIMATTTVLGDVVAAVAGDFAVVEVLIPLGADPHDYQPSARQVSSISDADLVVVNGLHLEEGLVDVLQAAKADGAHILEVAPLLQPISLAGDGDGGQERADDPHVWMDPIRMAEAARLIGEALEEVDSSREWSGRADAYAATLIETDKAIAELLSAVPDERRKMVTNHESFGYFALRYGFDLIGAVIPGGSTLAGPSSADLTDLVELMKREGVSVIFAETTQPEVLAQAVALELGNDAEVVELYSGSLGEAGSGAETLVGMLMENAVRVSEALR